MTRQPPPPCDSPTAMREPECPRMAGVAAAFAVALLLAVAVGLVLARTNPSRAQQAASPRHVGSAACEGCHAGQASAWRTSHHAHAMLPATPAAVRAAFAGETASSAGSRGRFFRDGERFLVETEGRDGASAVFAVSHVLGWEPLQQYLVTFPDGRIQALPWAWDTRPREAGGQRWFHVYGDEPVPPDDPRHWTRLLQGWNHMCAECHVTSMAKAYDAAADRFRSTWSETGVGCEACHGAGSGHVAWAVAGAGSGDPLKGFASAAKRRAVVDWAPDARTGSPVSAVSRPAGDEVDLCARCHARRATLSERWSPGHPLEDTHRPVLLTPDMFEDDGQMRDEVFNDHAFRQSLMYARGVVCSDCHDPHSGRLRSAGASVCGQCHDERRFARTGHTGHAEGPAAPDCIACHMPARTYMQVDRRHDHSFRVPRPDQTVSLGTPNACSACHQDRDAAWAAAAVDRWHGPFRRGYQTWAPAFHASRTGDPSARSLLQAVATDSAIPAVARATAVQALADWPAATSDAVVAAALADPDPLVRATALRLQEGLPAPVRWRRAAAALRDPVRLVRLAAAQALVDMDPASLSPEDGAALATALRELEEALQRDADRPEGRAALAALRLRQGRPAEAEAEYRVGLRLEPAAATLAVNLADLLRRQAREPEAEAVLRQALAASPGAAALHHALGLSLVRSRRADEALDQLRQAYAREPGTARYAYVYAVALQSAGQPEAAGKVLEDGLARSPSSTDLLTARLQRALRAGDTGLAGTLAARLSALRPDDADLARLAARLRP